MGKKLLIEIYGDCWLLDAGYLLLVAGYLMLDVGCLLLVTGYWLLVAGCLLMVTCG